MTIGVTSADAADFISFKTGTNFSEKMKIASLGDVTVSLGNVVMATSGKGIDFSATAGSGTSELFNDYEEGTWTPNDQSGQSLSFTGVTGTYTKIGRMVYLQGTLTYPSTANTTQTAWGGLPFTAANGSQMNAITWTDAGVGALSFACSTTVVYPYIVAPFAVLANYQASLKTFRFNIFYSV